MIIAGVGLGFSFVPVTIGAVTGIRPDQAGLASGLINTSQQIGGALGLGILVSIANSVTADSFASGVRDRTVALTDGFSDAFLAGAGFGLIGAILAVTMISTRDSRAAVKAARAEAG
jgi:MFS family permease